MKIILIVNCKGRVGILWTVRLIITLCKRVVPWEKNVELERFISRVKKFGTCPATWVGTWKDFSQERDNLISTSNIKHR